MTDLRPIVTPPGLSDRPTRIRTLSKSDFTLARTCDSKLYFRENGYPDNRESNQYLGLLRGGGYMVEALAKARYPEGIQLEYGRNVAEDFARTMRQLEKPDVTLFEATVLVGRRQARIDILEKTGDVVRLVEVKSKSFDGPDHQLRLEGKAGGAFRRLQKPYDIMSDWAEKLEDITYQTLLLEKVLPGVEVRPFLALVDRSKRARIDNIPQLFQLVSMEQPDGTSRLHSARYLGTSAQIEFLDLVTEVDVSNEVAQLRADVEEAAARFERLLDQPLAGYRPTTVLGSRCASCEFRSENVDRNGFAECWGSRASATPHMLELFSVGTAKGPDRSPLVEWMLANNKSGLLEIAEDLLVKADGSVGPQALRQRRQVEYTRRGEVFLDPALRARIESLNGPLHFIDFETSRLALPYHARMRPYGLVAFQWSVHQADYCGGPLRHQEWLNQVDIWPNRSFAESLRAAIGDAGSVLTWSPFEGAVLKDIIPEMGEFGPLDPELVDWMIDVCENRIVDLNRWAQVHYYHPAMRGRTSIKVVLDALWQHDPGLRAQFEALTGLPANRNDPYSALPPVVIAGIAQDVHEGTGAMIAYQEMMYGEFRDDPAVKAQWATLLKQYCSLDTLSMVLILDHWRRQVGLA